MDNPLYDDYEFEDIVNLYLSELYSGTYFGKCAGRITKLPLLHKNRVKNQDLQIESLRFAQECINNIIEMDMLEIFEEEASISPSQIHQIQEAINPYDFYNERDRRKMIDNLDSHFSTLVQIENFLHNTSIGQELLQVILDNTERKAGFASDFTNINRNGQRVDFPWAPFDFRISFSEDLLRNGCVDLAQSFDNGSFPNYTPISIYGNPGEGKTIFLRQLTHEITDLQLEKPNPDEVNVPFLMKAKSLIQALSSCSTGFTDVFLQPIEDGSDVFMPPFPKNKDEFVEVILNSSIECQPNLTPDYLEAILNDIGLLQSPTIFIIDAIDELSDINDYAVIMNFLEKIHDFTFSFPYVIQSCRYSHRDDVTLLTDTNDLAWPIDFEMEFTDNDLQNVMPVKLANAWGISSDRLSFVASKTYSKFQEVANNPLFVGLFCLLIQNNQLDEINRNYNSVRLPIKGKYSFAHVEFLKKIIEIGLDVNVKERQRNYNLESIRSDFLYVSAIHTLTGFDSFEKIFKTSEGIFNHKINSLNRKILKENLGIIYANDGKKIQFTHKTISEVGLGLLIKENGEFRNSIKGHYSHLIDNNWSNCTVLTLVDLEKIQEKNEDSLMQGLLSVIDEYPSSRHYIPANMLFLRQILVSGMTFSEGVLSFETTQVCIGWKQELIQKLTDFSNSGNPFSLPEDVFAHNKGIICNHQDWRVYWIKKSGGRIIPPLISKMSRSTVINWEKPEQIVEIWDVKQATQSLISNWEEYVILYGEETVAAGYASFLDESSAKRNYRTLDSGRKIKKLIKPILELKNKSIIEAYSKVLGGENNYNEDTLLNIELEDLLDDSIVREILAKSEFDWLNVFIGEYSDLKSFRKILNFLIVDSLYLDACKILIGSLESNPDESSFDNGIILLINMNAPMWMRDVEISMFVHSRRQMSAELAAAIMQSDLREFLD